jgi:hypothetical protein
MREPGRRNFNMPYLNQAVPVRNSPPLVSVYDGRECIGFILARGRTGFEAFDRNERSAGLFPTQQAAAAALEAGRT